MTVWWQPNERDRRQAPTGLAGLGLGLTLWLWLAFALTLAPTARAETAIPGTPGADPQRARLVYLVRQDCGSCHGLTLKGGLGRALTPGDLAHLDAESLKTLILDGIPGTPMPPWRPLLSEAEAALIADILKRGDAQ